MVIFIYRLFVSEYHWIVIVIFENITIDRILKI